ncbi:hypothetical protein Tco_0860474 [Tanacetum coccineum]|uniref:Uncharacterized protein n=1 Tax=Tanacetum coccineum TaxID=301880 RepID=A0ABQ5BI23_9ASTR
MLKVIQLEDDKMEWEQLVNGGVYVPFAPYSWRIHRHIVAEALKNCRGTVRCAPYRKESVDSTDSDFHPMCSFKVQEQLGNGASASLIFNGSWTYV